MIMTDMTVRAFSEKLASNVLAPGGGSAAALSGAIRQHRAERAFDADAVKFVAAHGDCAAGAETQGGGHVVTFARIDEADLPARDEGADFFVFRREVIARAAKYALHGG